MNGNKANYSKIMEIAAGVVAVVVALGGFISSILRPVLSFTRDEMPLSKVFYTIKGMENGLISLAFIVIGVALILRWVSQVKLKWVTFGAAVFAGLVFIINQITGYIHIFAYQKKNYGEMLHPITNLFIVLFYTIATIALLFLVFESQNHIVKKQSRTVTLIVAYAALWLLMFIAIALSEESGDFLFPLLLIICVFSRKEIEGEKNLAYYFGLGGIALASILALLNAFIDPIDMLVKETDIFSNLFNYNDATIVLATALIPLLFLSREFSSRTDLSK